MAKVIMVYASMTGNTEEIANLIAKGIQSTGVDLTIRELPQAEPQELAEYDGIVLGSYTYGEGELADEFLDYYDEMAELDLFGKVAAVFGSGDTAYEHFCAAVDILAAKLADLGAILTQEGLKIELSPDDEALCVSFGQEFGETVKEVFEA